MWSLSDTPCWLHTTYPTSLYVRLGRPKKMLRQENFFFFSFFFFFFFSSKNQRLVLVRLWKGHKGTICWEGQVVVSKTHTAGSIMGISYQILRREASIWAKVGMGQWSWSDVIAGCFQVHRKACPQIGKRLNTGQVEHFHNLLVVALASSSLQDCFQVRRKPSSKSKNVRPTRLPWQLAHSLLPRLASKIAPLCHVFFRCCST